MFWISLILTLLALISWRIITNKTKTAQRVESQRVKHMTKTTRHLDASLSLKSLKPMIAIDNITLPEPIPTARLFDQDNTNTRALFCERLRERGYVVLKRSEKEYHLACALRKEANDFFLETPLEEKRLLRDDMMSNLGFVHIAGVREYIKVRPNDADYLWPDRDSFRDVYHRFYDCYFPLAKRCLEIFGEHVYMGERMLDEDKMDAISNFIWEKSSVSMIRYFEHCEEDDKLVCADHRDSGLFTLLLRTDVPSLEIYDSVLKQYVKIEKLADERDLILYGGEKIPLFTASDYTAQPHRVKMRANTERISIAFLLDVAK